MTTKHTPGPWERVDVSTGSATVREQLCNNGSAALQIQYDGSPEGEANARLIAAAPELLEALVELLALAPVFRDTRKPRGSRRPFLSEHRSADNARSAIAKATEE